MQIYQGKLLAIDPSVIEAVTIEVNGLKIVAFSDDYKIEINKIYQLEFDLFLGDDDELNLVKISEPTYGLIRWGGSFSYEVYGKW